MKTKYIYNKLSLISNMLKTNEVAVYPAAKKQSHWQLTCLSKPEDINDVCLILNKLELNYHTFNTPLV